MPVVNAEVDSRMVWRSLNRPDEGNLLAAPWIEVSLPFLPALVERPGLFGMVAAIALMDDMPAGPTWHAAKTVECGGQCSVSPRGEPGPVFVEIDGGGFTVVPLDVDAACTPTSVAAHMLYENSDPFRLFEPPGVLDTSFATYTPIDARTVRVEGSVFEQTSQPTIKLEGSKLAGYETLSFVGIRDPHVLERIDEWLESVDAALHQRARSALGLTRDEYRFNLRCYGWNAILGSLEKETGIPREVGVLLKVRADDQDTATAIAQTGERLAAPYAATRDEPYSQFRLCHLTGRD